VSERICSTARVPRVSETPYRKKWSVRTDLELPARAFVSSRVDFLLASTILSQIGFWSLMGKLENRPTPSRKRSKPNLRSRIFELQVLQSPPKAFL
jgi:hypothetical protein